MRRLARAPVLHLRLGVLLPRVAAAPAAAVPLLVLLLLLLRLVVLACVPRMAPILACALPHVPVVAGTSMVLARRSMGHGHPQRLRLLRCQPLFMAPLLCRLLHGPFVGVLHLGQVPWLALLGLRREPPVHLRVRCRDALFGVHGEHLFQQVGGQGVHVVPRAPGDKVAVVFWELVFLQVLEAVLRGSGMGAAE